MFQQKINYSLTLMPGNLHQKRSQHQHVNLHCNVELTGTGDTPVSLPWQTEFTFLTQWRYQGSTKAHLMTDKRESVIHKLFTKWYVITIPKKIWLPWISLVTVNSSGKHVLRCHQVIVFTMQRQTTMKRWHRPESTLVTSTRKGLTPTCETPLQQSWHWRHASVIAMAMGWHSYWFINHCADSSTNVVNMFTVNEWRKITVTDAQGIAPECLQRYQESTKAHLMTKENL